MKIKYLGHSSFRIQGKTSTGEKITVVTDPFDPKSVGLPYPKQECDIATLSHAHDDHNCIEGIKGNSPDDYFLINAPGEYELSGLRIFGINSFHDDKKGSERGKNTIYIFDFDEARVAHLGDLGHTLSSDQLEALELADIVITPVGGIFTIDAKTALVVSESIEPKIIIPMHYKTDKHSETFKEVATLEDFLKEANGMRTETVEELSIKYNSDLPTELTITVLTA